MWFRENGGISDKSYDLILTNEFSVFRKGELNGQTDCGIETIEKKPENSDEGTITPWTNLRKQPTKERKNETM